MSRFARPSGAAVVTTAIALLTGAAFANSAPSRAGGAIARGEAIYREHCAACHGDGIGNPGLRKKPGTAALQAKYQGVVPALLSERTDLTPEVVKLFVRQGISIMPFFRKTEIGDSELDDLAAYLSRDSHTD